MRGSQEVCQFLGKEMQEDLCLIEEETQLDELLEGGHAGQESLRLRVDVHNDLPHESPELGVGLLAQFIHHLLQLGGHQHEDLGKAQSLLGIGQQEILLEESEQPDYVLFKDHHRPLLLTQELLQGL